MDTPNETAPDVTWQVMEIEATARDLVDLAFWEAAEEEERLCIDSAPTDVYSATFFLLSEEATNVVRTET